MNISYITIAFNHRLQLIASLSRHSPTQVCVITLGERQKDFFQDICLNWNAFKVESLTINEFLTAQTLTNKMFLLMQPPYQFQQLQRLITKVNTEQNSLILVLFQSQRKYINMMKKKIENIQVKQLSYSSSKLMGANGKIREMVEQNYDMNRKAFYAYGEYLQYVRKHPLKRIFTTMAIPVTLFALNYGFTTPPRVKQGMFSRKVDKKQLLKKVKKSKRITKV